MQILETLEQIISAALADKGFDLVHLDLEGGKQKTLQVMIERQDGRGITTDDCVTASRLISVLLDIEDPIPGSYTLEVSSPGLDRPLVKREDYKKFAGSKVKLKLSVPYHGARNVEGILKGIEDDCVILSLTPTQKDKFEVAEFAFSDIQKAKLVPDYDM